VALWRAGRQNLDIPALIRADKVDLGFEACPPINERKTRSTLLLTRVWNGWADIAHVANTITVRIRLVRIKRIGTVVNNVEHSVVIDVGIQFDVERAVEHAIPIILEAVRATTVIPSQPNHSSRANLFHPDEIGRSVRIDEGGTCGSAAAGKVRCAAQIAQRGWAAGESGPDGTGLQAARNGLISYSLLRNRLIRERFSCDWQGVLLGSSAPYLQGSVHASVPASGSKLQCHVGRTAAPLAEHNIRSFCPKDLDS